MRADRLKEVVVDGEIHVEMPRNPVDFELDKLSSKAIDLLGRFDCQEPDRTIEFHGLPPEGTDELVVAGFLVHSGGKYALGGKRQSWKLTRTFDGWNATERYKCGLYHRHKEIHEARAARDSQIENNPLFGHF